MRVFAKILAAALSVCLVVVAVPIFSKAGRLPDGYARTKGTVVKTRGRYRGQHLTPTIVATAQFEIAGDTFTVVGDNDFTSVGKEVLITYPTSDPSRAVIGDGGSNDRAGAMLLFLPAIGLAIAARRL